jgi:regulator of cell morphogenesis and NO signaling
MKFEASHTVAEVITQNFNNSEFFRIYGIEYCCTNFLTIEDVCNSRNINLTYFLSDLNKYSSIHKSNEFYNEMNIPELIDYIVGVYHEYFYETIDVVIELFETISRDFSESHPEILAIIDLIKDLKEEALAHMNDEEEVLFPKLQNRELSDLTEEVISEIIHDHQSTVELLKKIRMLSNDFCPPSDADENFRLGYNYLQEMEKNLIKHIHIENNVLFRKILRKTF